MNENFYFQDPDDGIERYPTLEAAKEAAESALDHWREKASGESWHENIEHLEYGIMVPVGTVQQTNYRETPESNSHDYTCDYELVASDVPNHGSALRYVPAKQQQLSDEEDAALRRIHLKFLALYYQAKESPTADAGELLEMKVARDALDAYRWEDVRVSGISLIAQEWAEQRDTARDNHAEDYMERICGVLGTTYGGDPESGSIEEEVERR